MPVWSERVPADIHETGRTTKMREEGGKFQRIGDLIRIAIHEKAPEREPFWSKKIDVIDLNHRGGYSLRQAPSIQE